MEQTANPQGLLRETRRYFTPTQIASIWPELHSVEPPLTALDSSDLKMLPIETQLSLLEISGYLQNMLLRDSDWATMQNHQELRVPYLGKRYMETVISIPWAEKRSTQCTPKPLLINQLPLALKYIKQRPKSGFVLDYAAYLCGPLRDYLYSAFTYLNQNFGFQLQPDQVEQKLIMGDPQKQVRRYWALTSLGFYLQQHG